jgi:hypothetical protein
MDSCDDDSCAIASRSDVIIIKLGMCFPGFDYMNFSCRALCVVIHLLSSDDFLSSLLKMFSVCLVRHVNCLLLKEKAATLAWVFTHAHTESCCHFCMPGF